MDGRELMTFSMQRPDIMSYGDLAIQRGLRMLHHHRRITPELFAKYRRRYTPYGAWLRGEPLPVGDRRGRRCRPARLGAEGRRGEATAAGRGERRAAGGLNGRLTIVTVSLLTCTKEAERVQFAGKRAYNRACPTVEPNAMVNGKRLSSPSTVS